MVTGVASLASMRSWCVLPVVGVWLTDGLPADG
jgi:hypothetical protein